MGARGVRFHRDGCLLWRITVLFIRWFPSPQLPIGSAAQQVAMQCWCLHFQPQDHSFLMQSNVFANISTALSGAEEAPEGTPGAPLGEKKGEGRDTVSW